MSVYMYVYVYIYVSVCVLYIYVCVCVCVCVCVLRTDAFLVSFCWYFSKLVGFNYRHLHYNPTHCPCHRQNTLFYKRQRYCTSNAWIMFNILTGLYNSINSFLMYTGVIILVANTAGGFGKA